MKKCAAGDIPGGICFLKVKNRNTKKDEQSVQN